MQVGIHVTVLRVENREGKYLDKVSGQEKAYKSTRLYCMDPDGYVGVFTWVSDEQVQPERGHEYDILLRKFEDSPTGATGIAVGYA